MKKVLVVMTIVALVFSMATCFAEAQDNVIKVTVNGEEVTFDQGPVLVEEKPMVPMRAVFEKMGAFVSWDNDTETATAIKEDMVVMIQIGNEKMFKISEAIVLETPAMLINDRTLIPAEAIAAALDYDVQWNSETSEIVITEKVEEPEKEEASSEENVEEEAEVKESTSEENTEEAPAENNEETVTEGAEEEVEEEVSEETVEDITEETVEETTEEISSEEDAE